VLEDAAEEIIRMTPRASCQIPGWSDGESGFFVFIAAWSRGLPSAQHSNFGAYLGCGAIASVSSRCCRQRSEPSSVKIRLPPLPETTIASTSPSRNGLQRVLGLGKSPPQFVDFLSCSG